MNVTYGQQYLLDLIKEKKLAQFCRIYEVDHPGFFRIAIGETGITYKNMCAVCHVIPPIYWLYYTDEKLPYEGKCVPQWNPQDISKFVAEHTKCYRDIAKQFNITVSITHKILSTHENKPTARFIREMAAIADPIEFFIAPPKDKYIPQQGDIISLIEPYKVSNYFVISGIHFFNENCILLCEYANEKPNFHTIHSISLHDAQITYTSRLSDERLAEVMQEFKTLIDL